MRGINSISLGLLFTAIGLAALEPFDTGRLISVEAKDDVEDEDDAEDDESEHCEDTSEESIEPDSSSDVTGELSVLEGSPVSSASASALGCFAMRNEANIRLDKCFSGFRICDRTFRLLFDMRGHMR